MCNVIRVSLPRLALLAMLLANVATSHAGLAGLGHGEALAEERLEEMRGGLSMGNGLQASFGITRTVSVNGEVVAIQGLVLRNLDNLFSGGLPNVEQIGKALTIVQIGPNNSAPVASAAANAGAGLALVSVNPVTNAVTNVPAIVNGNPGVTSPSPSTTAPTGASTSSFTIPTVTSGGPHASGFGTSGSLSQSIATGVQNSLNNVLLQTRTTIDAMIGGQSLLRSQQRPGAYRDQMLGR